MKYLEQYTSNDLFDMFANQADADKLVVTPTDTIAADLAELAPDMQDPVAVARSIQKTAAAQRLHQNT